MIGAKRGSHITFGLLAADIDQIPGIFGRIELVANLKLFHLYEAFLSISERTFSAASRFEKDHASNRPFWVLMRQRPFLRMTENSGGGLVLISFGFCESRRTTPELRTPRPAK